MTESCPNNESIFHAARDIPDADRRREYVREACGDETRIAHVEALLAAADSPDSLLDHPAVSGVAATLDPPITEVPGTVIGPYKLLEQIGEGGFGIVFLAEQTRPVRRKVALKVLKAGMDTPQAVARFEAERQALAIMDHPNIAQVFDGAATPSGRPYFVMELVKGTPINEFCDQNDLTQRQRMQLFVTVCQAVQHAHQKGIIHRDLKPSNVLVSRHDTTPVVKVIDFGVAKALEPVLTDRTLFTGVAQMIGTPLYMSPEQAGMSDLDVDTRSDVYSLGVLLYELLTGTTPFEKERFKNAGYDEIRRIIREEEPCPPSIRLSTLGSAASTLSAGRGAEPRTLSTRIRGELDWVVMKALEKDRNRRYATANAFADDVQRFLRGEVVQAVPPSAWYRCRKLVRRNRAAFAATGAALVMIVLATTGVAINSWLVTREKKQKEEALETAVAEKKRADENLIRARQAVKDYLIRVTEHPQLNSSDFVDLRKELLNSAIPFYREFVRQQYADPELEAERAAAYAELATLRFDVDELEGALADVREAEAIFARLATSNPDQLAFRRGWAEAINTRGNILDKQGQSDPAEAAYREALGILDELATEHPAAAEYRESLARTGGNLAVLLKDLNRLDESDAALRRCISLREELLAAHPQRSDLRASLAQAWINRGDLEMTRRRPREAEEAFLSALELIGTPPNPEVGIAGKMTAAFPTPSPSPRRGEGDAEVVFPAILRQRQLEAQAWNNLGLVYRSSHRMDDAENAMRKALTIKEELADRFPSVPRYRLELARSWSNLGVVLSKTSRSRDAQEAYDSSIAIYERLSANSSAPGYLIELAGTYVNLGRLIGDNGQLEQSLPVLTRSIEILEPAVLEDPELVKARESLCFAYWTRAMTLAGVERFRESVSDWDRAIELDDGRYAGALRNKRASTLLNLKEIEN